MEKLFVSRGLLGMEKFWVLDLGAKSYFNDNLLIMG